MVSLNRENFESRYIGNMLPLVQGDFYVYRSATLSGLEINPSPFRLDKVQIAPAKEGGLWWVGPTTPEEIESEEHERSMRKRLKEISEELKVPIY